MGNGLTAHARFQIARVFRDGTLVGMSDRDILERFVERRDEMAFEAILTRHGAMVRNVCRQMLFDPHDVDDAVQAVFLVLVRKARSIRIDESLGPWLYSVAGRVAARARANRRKRWARERSNRELAEPSYSSTADAAEIPLVIHDELGRLPERLRAPLVLCYLHGLTHDLAARELHCPVGTVRSRLARGRSILHRRITRRGLTLSAAGLGALLESSAGAAGSSRLPASMFRSITRAMLESARHNGTGSFISFTTIQEGVSYVSQIKKIAILATVIPAGLIALALTQRTAVVGQTPEPSPQMSAEARGSVTAPANPEKPPETEPTAEPIEPYPLTKDAGPLMVLARVFRGPAAQRLAIALAKELRTEYGLPAYILRKKEYPGGSKIRGMPPTDPSAVKTTDIKEPEKIHTFDVAAVLVGNEKTHADQEKLWHEVKKIQPRCLEKMSSPFPSRRTLITAIRTTNPYVPAKNLALSADDDLVIRMNAGPRSIGNCPGRYSLQVAEFSGRSCVDIPPSDPSFVISTNIKDSPLRAAHDHAERLAEKLAAAPEVWRIGQPVYVFHDRSASKVYLGSFNSVEDPAVWRVLNELIRDASILSNKKERGMAATDTMIVPALALTDVNDIKAKIRN
jgi:RNA polymerase sigma factor (sigma-70 family)